LVIEYGHNKVKVSSKLAAAIVSVKGGRR
jgi:hypothetical protein